MMWEVVYADGRVNELEDNIILRVADLLGVTTRRDSGWSFASRLRPTALPCSLELPAGIFTSALPLRR